MVRVAGGSTRLGGCSGANSNAVVVVVVVVVAGDVVVVVVAGAVVVVVAGVVVVTATAVVVVVGLAGLTVMVKVRVALPPRPSSTVTTTTYGDSWALPPDTTPLMTPVDSSIPIPAGRPSALQLSGSPSGSVASG
jgi:hypothetical protein